jgi:hypothetical protein
MMTNPYLPVASFPTSVWDGTSHNKENVFDSVDPGYRDYDRCSSEVIAVQDYLSTPFPYADFEVGASPPEWSEGRVFYDDDEKTFAIYNNEPDVTLQLGQEIYIRATNKTGSEIVNGKICYINGAQGNRPTIALAQADAPGTARVLGITTHNIADNATGFLTVIGLVRGLNTDSCTEGGSLYLSATDPGDFTEVAPEPPSFPIHIGTVVRKSIEEGAILVNLGPTDVVGPMVIQSLTINTTLDVSGDMLFIGSGSGLAFGEIFVKDNAAPTVLSSAGHTQILVFDADGGSNNTTPDHTNDHITITKAGKYLVMVSIVALNGAGASHTIHVELFKNNGGTDFDNVHAHRTLAAGADKGSISLSGIVDAAVDDTLELWATTNRGVDSNVTFEDITFSIMQIGGN